MGKVIKFRRQPVEILLEDALELVEKAEVREGIIFLPDAKEPGAFRLQATNGITLTHVAMARAALGDLERTLIATEVTDDPPPHGDAS